MKRNAEVLLVIALIVLVGVSASLSFFIFSVPQDDWMDLGFGMPVFMPSGRMMSSAFIRNEYDFLVHMIPHHEEAVDTAMILLDNTEREEMKEFAEGIIRTQTDEIEQMKEWLIIWYPDQNHEINYQPMMRDLQGMKGAVLDEAFIEDMIPHHMAAVMMAQQLLIQGLAEHDEVAALAREIRDNQRTEIHVMMR